MPCLSGNYDPKVGVIVQVAVAPGGHLKAAQGPNASAINIAPVAGLIDTGADATCISPAVVNSVGLKPTGKIQTMGVTGASPLNQYTVDLALQFGAGGIGIENLVVTEYSMNSNHFDVLIGRDVICRGVFTMDFNGRFSFSV